jgi:hypothetical protein
MVTLFDSAACRAKFSIPLAVTFHVSCPLSLGAYSVTFSIGSLIPTNLMTVARHCGHSERVRRARPRHASHAVCEQGRKTHTIGDCRWKAQAGGQFGSIFAVFCATSSWSTDLMLCRASETLFRLGMWSSKIEYQGILFALYVSSVMGEIGGRTPVIN